MANLLDKIRGKDNNTVGNVDKFSSAVSDLSNTLMDFNSDFKSTTTAFTNDLRGILNKASQNNSDSNNEQSDNNDDFLRKLERNTEKSIDKTQVISSAIIKSFEAVAGYAIKKFTDASSRVMSDYNQNLTAITVRQQWTNSQYTKELREATDWIKNNGLVTQFSQIDWTSALSDALSMGLRDEVAVRVAEQNLITNKLLPQLNTSSRTYTRASKLLGDDLGKNVVAIGKYTEQLYGAEGLEDGQVNNFLETISKEIIASGAQNGLSKAEVSEQLGNVLGTYQQYSAQYSSEYAENVLGSLKGIMSGNLDDVMANQAMQGSGIEIGNAASLTPENISKYFEIYTQKTDEAGKRAGAGVMANMAGYGNYDNILDVQISNAYGDVVKDWMSQVADTVNVDNLYNKDVNDLKEGDYQSITDQQNKWNENMVANASSLLAEKIPDTEGVLNNISGVLTTWFGVWTTLNTAGKLFGNEGGSAGGKLGSKLFDKGGALGQGGKLALTAADSAGGTALTGLGTALSAASLAAGVVWGAHDGKKAVDTSKANNLTKGQQAANFFGGFFTGRDTIGMTEDQKAEYYQQNGTFSVKDMLSNAGKYGLIGAGSGALIGSAVPGAGTAAGAAIGGIGGAVTGAITNAIDQLQDAHHFKELQEATQNATDSISKMSSVTDGYGTAVQNNAQLMKDYYTITDENKASTEEGTEAFNRLKDAYPEMLGNVEDVSKLDETYIGQLKTKIELEKIELDKKLKDAGDYDLDVGAYDKQLSQAAYSFADWAKSHEGFTEEEANNQVAEIADKYYEGDKTKVWSLLQSDFGKGVVNYDSGGWSMEDPHYEFDTGKGSSVFNYDYASALNKNDDTLNNIFDSGSGPWGEVYNEYLMLQQAYDAAVSAADGDISKADFTAVKNSAETFSKHMTKFKDDILTTGPATTKYNNNYRSLLSGIPDIYKAIGMEDDMPSYRIGTDFITQGGPIMSHLGEAVLTSDTTKKLTYLSNGAGGITGFVNTLFGLSKSDVPTSSAAGSDTEVSLDPVVDAIKEQTTELQDSLSKIMILISALVPETEFAEVDKLLATYQGASA